MTSQFFPIRSRFGAANFERVAEFCCARAGEPETRWEQDVSEWIKAPRGTGGALDAVADGHAEVWLFDDPAGALIGFGSLGTQELHVSGRDEVLKVYAIPYFGLQTAFRGQPTGPPEKHFARLIFQSLIDEAEQRAEYPLLTLYVDPENPAFTKFYPAFHFQELERITLGGREWVRMVRVLHRRPPAVAEP